MAAPKFIDNILHLNSYVRIQADHSAIIEKLVNQITALVAYQKGTLERIDKLADARINEKFANLSLRFFRNLPNT